MLVVTDPAPVPAAFTVRCDSVAKKLATAVVLPVSGNSHLPRCSGPPQFLRTISSPVQKGSASRNSVLHPRLTVAPRSIGNWHLLPGPHSPTGVRIRTLPVLTTVPT